MRRRTPLRLIPTSNGNPPPRSKTSFPEYRYINMITYIHQRKGDCTPPGHREPSSRGFAPPEEARTTLPPGSQRGPTGTENDRKRKRHIFDHPASAKTRGLFSFSARTVAARRRSSALPSAADVAARVAVQGDPAPAPRGENRNHLAMSPDGARWPQGLAMSMRTGGTAGSYTSRPGPFAAGKAPGRRAGPSASPSAGPEVGRGLLVTARTTRGARATTARPA